MVARYYHMTAFHPIAWPDFVLFFPSWTEQTPAADSWTEQDPVIT